jgi:AcrR family transcriptional regulator
MVSKPPTTPKRGRIRKVLGHYHHGDLKQALVAAAEQQVARTADIDLSLREVAAAAGVTHAAAYRHFQGKTDLLAELARRGFESLEKSLKATIANLPCAERLVAAGVAYVRFAANSPGLFRVMFHPSLKPLAQHPGLLQAADAALTVLKDIVAETMEHPRPLHTIAAWATIHGQAVLQLDQHLVVTFGVDDSQADSTARAVIQTMVDGLKRASRSR